MTLEVFVGALSALIAVVAILVGLRTFGEQMKQERKQFADEQARARAQFVVELRIAELTRWRSSGHVGLAASRALQYELAQRYAPRLKLIHAGGPGPTDFDQRPVMQAEVQGIEAMARTLSQELTILRFETPAGFDSEIVNGVQNALGELQGRAYMLGEALIELENRRRALLNLYDTDLEDKLRDARANESDAQKRCADAEEDVERASARVDEAREGLRLMLEDAGREVQTLRRTVTAAGQ